MKKTRETAKIGVYVGGIAGVILFAIVGLLPSSFLGGIIGVNIASGFLGTPVEPSLIARLIVGVSMVLSIAMAGLFFVLGAMTLGWAVGYAIDALKHSKSEVTKLAVNHK